MRRLLSLLAVVLVGVVLFALVATRAHAQGAPPELRAGIDAEVVGVGDVVQYTLSANSTTGQPTDPQPGALPGFAVAGRSVSPSRSISIINGQRTDREGVNATWMLKATTVGTYTLGPASVDVGGARYSASQVRVKVVPAGQAPQRAPRGGASPFGGMQSPFGGPGAPFGTFDPWRDLFGDEPPQTMRPMAPPLDARFALPAPLAQGLFLHATVDKRRAVVGEQVTLTVYAYIDPEASEPDIKEAHEVTTPSFVRQPVAEDAELQKQTYFANVGGRIWAVRPLRKLALFPLKAGDLEIGPMTLSLARRGGKTSPRESETLSIRVTEPPVQGRPAGYVLGDVGNFRLNATVEPREISAGGAVAVTVELSGTGNLPSTLTPPARPGVEWLPPEMRSKVGPGPGDRIGGTRTFSYVVRLSKEGAIDLGAITLPFWEPSAKTYGMARAELGTVEVGPSTAPPPAASAAPAPAPDALATLPSPLGRMGDAPVARAHLAEGRFFWLALVAPALGWAAFRGGRGALRVLSERQAATVASPAAELKERMAAAEVASAGADPKLGDAAIVRALEAATLARLGLNVRGIPADQVATALEERSVPSPTARAYAALLETCGKARFSPEAGDMAAVRGRWGEAKGLVKELA